MRIPGVHDTLSDRIDGVCFPLLVFLDPFAALCIPVNAVASLTVHSETASLVTDWRVVDGGHLVLSLDILNSECLVVEESLGKGIETGGAEVVHAIVFGKLVMEFENRVILGDVDRPSFNLNWEHSLSVEDETSEARECWVVGIRGHRTSP